MSTVHRLPILDVSPEPHAPEPHDSGDEGLLQVGDLARICDKTVRAIHHYENLGLLSPHKRSKGRYRLYAPDAVARVNWIGKLHAMGMTLSEIQQILSTWEQAPSAPEAMAKMRAVYHQKLKEVHAQIARLSSLERELHASLEYLDTCEICDPTELVAACSACTVHKCHEHEPELVAGLYAGSLSLASAADLTGEPHDAALSDSNRAACE